VTDYVITLAQLMSKLLGLFAESSEKPVKCSPDERDLLYLKIIFIV